MEVAGGHGQGQCEDGRLRGGVEGALRQAGGGRDGAGVDAGGVLGTAQARQGGPGDADPAEHVHVQDVPPLLVVVVGDGAPGADAGVVHQDVQAAQALGLGGDRGAHGRVVGDVAPQCTEYGPVRLGQHVRVAVEHREAGTARGEQTGGGEADSGGATGRECGQAGRLAACVGASSGMLLPSRRRLRPKGIVPIGAAGRPRPGGSPEKPGRSRSRPGAAGVAGVAGRRCRGGRARRARPPGAGGPGGRPRQAAGPWAGAAARRRRLARGAPGRPWPRPRTWPERPGGRAGARARPGRRPRGRPGAGVPDEMPDEGSRNFGDFLKWQA